MKTKECIVKNQVHLHLVKETNYHPTKFAIIQQFEKLVCKQGYYGTSIKDVADACGIQKSSVYHHFNSKEDILLSIIESVTHDFDHAFNVYCQNGLLTENAKLIYSNILLSLLKSTGLQALLFTGPETIDAMEKVKIAIRTFFTNWLDFIKKINPEADAVTHKNKLANYIGHCMLAKMFNNDEDIENACMSL